VDTGKNAAQRMVAGRERRRGECQNGADFVLARNRRLDLVTVRAVAERRPPERSAVEERREATRFSETLVKGGDIQRKIKSLNIKGVLMFPV
jgi:hypothetical protein